jgi:uncharacterized repeat protein (TIGR01451 family)
MNTPCNPVNLQPVGPFWLILIGTVTLMWFPAAAAVQGQPANGQTEHFLYDYGWLPGEVAFCKTLARPSMNGYFQPVRLQGPAGSEIAVYEGGAFHTTRQRGNTVGLMVGHIYRLKITRIPGHPGTELYPTVEIVGRLYPPPGQETRFPIPVQIVLDDLEPAMAGALVTRVIYLENPRIAIAEQRGPDDQPFFDVGSGEDPLRAAEKFGRPMAIVRIGSRIPDNTELDSFGLGTPPVHWLDSASLQSAPDSRVADPLNPGAQRSAAPALSSRGERVYRDSAVQQATWLEPQEPVAAPQSPRQESAPPATADAGAAAVPAVAGHQDLFDAARPMFHLPPWEDEVLLDGGDRDLPALIKDLGERWEVRGLDTEDTIAHFDTLDGRRIVDTSNRVAIYAPRFAAVRKIDRPGRTQFTNLLGEVDDETSASTSRRSDFSTTTLQNLQPSRHKRLTQVVGVENRTRGVPVENVSPLNSFRTTFRTFENLRLMKTGFLDNREKGRLSMAVQRAQSWEGDVSAQSTMHKLQVIVVDDVKRAEEAIHVKTEFDRPQIRLVKIASTDAAHPGDVVDFTIRFDNVGDQTIGNVTIMDNLTGRLAYVEGSAECSLPATFVTEANGSGSLILRWEISDPLPATRGGVIRFQCRVR